MTKNSNLQIYRGIAILMVAMFHFTYQWHSLFSWGGHVQSAFFQSLTMGVQFFFMISGFVIYMSLERTASLWDFINKRIARLVPALVLISPMLFIAQKIWPVYLFPNISIWSIPTSIFILNPTLIAFFFHIQTNFVTGVQWTLTYEITFYLVAGIIFFALSKKYVFSLVAMIANLILFSNYFALGLMGKIGSEFETGSLSHPSFEYTLEQTGLLHLSWFGLGMWFKKYSGHKSNFSGVISFLNLLFLCSWDAVGGRQFIHHIGRASISLFFTLIFVALFFQLDRGRGLASSLVGKVLGRLGDVSYEFYLLHEVLGVIVLSEISKLDFFKSPWLGLFAIPTTIFLLFGLSKIINRKISVPVQNKINSHSGIRRIKAALH